MKKRGVIVSSALAWWIIAIVVLAVLLIFYFALRASGINIVETLKDFLKFKR